jgi:4-alpha-glucanotransferase
MRENRTAGILLHPTSLPGPFGIGDIGSQARRWLDFLAQAGQTVWQVLPLGPTGYGDSPYQCFSVFAGNPLLISPESLADDGLLTPEELADRPTWPPHAVDYAEALSFKQRILRKAYGRFLDGAASGLLREWRSFRVAENAWLGEYALFTALKRAHDNRPWWEWEREIALCVPAALARARSAHVDAIDQACFEQFVFFRQWGAVRGAARERGIRIVGDAPLYAALDSAEVWMHKKYFSLDPEGRPTAAAGVPPDYFSATGQLWGNPVFRWDVLRKENYRWFVDRLRNALRQYDLVRLDHFRGYQAYWEVPAGQPTAETGRWVPGPGAGLFAALRNALGGLPFIAEDLGIITDEVTALREKFQLPGMRVLQFAFGDTSRNPFLPHNYDPRTVVYTGTHDNDTTRGWYGALSEAERDLVRRYLARDGGDIAWDFIRLAWSSVAETAIAPLQDVIDLGSEARMNHPGTPTGNWTWRFREQDLGAGIAARLREITERYGRNPDLLE